VFDECLSFHAKSHQDVIRGIGECDGLFLIEKEVNILRVSIKRDTQNHMPVAFKQTYGVMSSVRLSER